MELETESHEESSTSVGFISKSLKVCCMRWWCIARLVDVLRRFVPIFSQILWMDSVLFIIAKADKQPALGSMFLQLQLCKAPSTEAVYLSR
jgi:hypothetical protein